MLTADGFTDHFTFNELTDSGGHPDLVNQNRIDAQRYLLAGKRLSKLLDSVRVLFGNQPITVSSGFRNPALNKAVGSRATNSAHMRFEAADIIPSNMSVADGFNLLMRSKDQLPDMRKAIIETVGTKKWIHIQVKMNASDSQDFYTTSDGVSYTKVG